MLTAWPLIGTHGTSPSPLATVTGGLSGAKVWRVQNDSGDWALRRWPDDGIEVARLLELHRWLGYLRDSANLPVAVPIASHSRETLVSGDESWWQLEPWLPGEPLLTGPREPDQLADAMQKLAHLHLASSRYEPTPSGWRWFNTGQGTCPAVGERLSMLLGWSPYKIARRRAAVDQLANGSGQRAARRILETGAGNIITVAEQLQSVERLNVPTLPCLRDARPEHFLFTKGTVTGIIDPSAARMDSTATDLTRLLGGCLVAGRSAWSEALVAYESIRPLSENEHRLLDPLDRSNTLLSGLTWIDRAANGQIDDTNPETISRMTQLADRLELLFGSNDTTLERPE